MLTAYVDRVLGVLRRARAHQGAPPGDAAAPAPDAPEAEAEPADPEVLAGFRRYAPPAEPTTGFTLRREPELPPRW